MSNGVTKKYKVEVKARLVGCPRCGGWTTVEPDMFNGAWRVCVNCGWEQAVEAGEAVTAGKSS